MNSYTTNDDYYLQCVRYSQYLYLVQLNFFLLSVLITLKLILSNDFIQPIYAICVELSKYIKIAFAFYKMQSHTYFIHRLVEAEESNGQNSFGRSDITTNVERLDIFLIVRKTNSDEQTMFKCPKLFVMSVGRMVRNIRTFYGPLVSV